MKIKFSEKSWIIFFLLSIVLISGVIAVINNINDGWQIPSGAIAATIYTPENCQYDIGNSCGKDAFVPTKTSAEWNNFKFYKPSCLSATKIPVNGGWSACSYGTHTCTNPSPSCGGSGCSGSSSCCVNQGGSCSGSIQCCTGLCDGNGICNPCDKTCPETASQVNCGTTHVWTDGCGGIACTVVGTKQSCGTGYTCLNGACCSTTCPSSDTITCGTSYNNACGTFCGKGTKCTTGETCSGGLCVPTCTSTGCPSASTICSGVAYYDNCNNYCGTGTKPASTATWSSCSSTSCTQSGTTQCNAPGTCGGPTTCSNPTGNNGQVKACYGTTCSSGTCDTSTHTCCTPTDSYWGSCSALQLTYPNCGPTSGYRSCVPATCGGSTAICTSIDPPLACSWGGTYVCLAGETCINGQCITTCNPSCTGADSCVKCPSGYKCITQYGSC